MPTPDVSRARRQLRRARIQDALGLERGPNVIRYRNQLIELVARAAASPVAQFGELLEEDVDTLVSVAATAVEEDPLDSLSVDVLAIEALSSDGQFARLAQLAPSLLRSAQQLQTP